MKKKSQKTEMTPAMRQLLVDAAAALNNLTDLDAYGDGSGEYNEDQKAGVSLARRLYAAAAGKNFTTRTWDVAIKTTVTVTLSAGIDPGTEDGLVAIREAAKQEIIEAVEGDCFDVTVEEYVEE